MSKAIQVAFQLPSDEVAELDGLVPDEFSSRAAALRVAVHWWLSERREAAIDAALAVGYGTSSGAAEEVAWADLSVEGLSGADLDW